MKTTRTILVSLAVASLAACSGGGIDLNVSTVDNSVDNSSTTTGGGGGGTGRRWRRTRSALCSRG